MLEKNPPKIRIGSRTSHLAQVQVQEILSLLEEQNISIEHDLVTSLTQGDRDKSSSLKDHAIDNFFTDELDQALLKAQVDITIHSAKDLPKRLHPGLKIVALTQSPDTTDALVSHVAFKDLASGARIGTSSALRQQMVKDLNPELETCDIRGTIQERIKQFEEGKYDGIIVATVALKRLGLEKYIKDIMPWEGIALQGQLAVVARVDDEVSAKIFSAIDVRQAYGKVTLVGAGPGDPELITIKAVKALEQADVVFYDYLLHKDILKYVNPSAEKMYVGKRKGEHSLSQAELSRLLKEHAFQGKKVVRLKCGDPLVFGRGAEEVEYLDDYHIPFEIIPGVSSATGLPSSLGIPLTARNQSSSVAFITAHQRGETDQELPISIPKADTVIVFMGLSKLETIIATFNKDGWNAETPVIVISRGSYVDEKIVDGTLESIVENVKEAQLKPPALIIVGQTVTFWKERARGNQRILYTGSNPDKYQALGKIVHLPMIQIGPAQLNTAQWTNILNNLYTYDVILLTSQFGVKYFFEQCKKDKIDLTSLHTKVFFVIGRHTANVLSHYGFTPSVMANLETSEGLLNEIKVHGDVSGKQILFPRSSLPNPYLKNELTKLGAKVEELTVYENTKPPKKPLPDEPIDSIFFTSPSTVRNFLDDYKEIPQTWKILSKGDVTNKYLEEKGYTSEILVNA